MYKTYRDAIIKLCKQTGIPMPDYISNDQRQLSRLIDEIAEKFKNGTMTKYDEFGDPAELVIFGDARQSTQYKLTVADGTESVESDIYMGNFVELSLPDSLKRIGPNTFVGMQIESLTIPKGIMSLGENAFGGCEYLTSILWRADMSYEEYTEYIKENSGFSRDVFINSPIESIVFDDDVEVVPPDCFNGLSSLVSVTLNEGLKRIMSGTFEYAGFTSIELPSTLQIIEHGAFYGTNLEEITIPAGVRLIDRNVFDSCQYLKNAYLLNPDCVIDSNAFSVYYGIRVYLDYEFPTAITELTVDTPKPAAWQYISNLTFKPGLKKIGDDAMGYMPHLETVTFGDNLLEEIGANAFCSNYLNITNLPSSLKTLGRGAFDSAHIAFKEIPAGVSVMSARCFNYADVEEMAMPGITTLSSNSFSYTENLAKVWLPNTFDTVDMSVPGDAPFYAGNRVILVCLEAASVPEGLPASWDYIWSSTDRLIVITGMSRAQYDAMKIIPAESFYEAELAEYTIASDVACIGCRAFSMTALESIDFPASVRTILSGAFRQCSALAEVTFHEGLLGIGSVCFAYCTALTTIQLPSTTRKVQDYAFQGCTGLTSAIVNGNLGYGAFTGCNHLATLTLNTVESIGSNAFEGCTALVKVALPTGLKELDTYAFKGCTGLRKVWIPNTVVDFMYQPFNGCGDITLYCESASKPASWSSSWNAGAAFMQVQWNITRAAFDAL